MALVYASRAFAAEDASGMERPSAPGTSSGGRPEDRARSSLSALITFRNRSSRKYDSRVWGKTLAGSCDDGRCVVGARSCFASCDKMHDGHVNGACDR